MLNGTSNGYSWDSINSVCYKCSSTQYYDPTVPGCVNCPSCATTCSN